MHKSLLRRSLIIQLETYLFINESPIQCNIEYCAGSEQRANSVGGMVHYIKTRSWLVVQESVWGKAVTHLGEITSDENQYNVPQEMK